MWTVGDKDDDHKFSQLSQNEITIQVLPSIHFNKSNPSKIKPVHPLKSKLGYMPMNIIEVTFKNIT